MRDKVPAKQRDQRALADAAHPQDDHEPTLLLPNPLDQFSEFCLTTREVAHIQRPDQSTRGLLAERSLLATRSSDSGLAAGCAADRLPGGVLGIETGGAEGWVSTAASQPSSRSIR